LVSDGSQLPVFSARLRSDIEEYSVYDVSDRLRMRGWLVPAYRMPPDIEDMTVLRVVVRNGFGRDLASMLVADLERELSYLEAHGGQLGATTGGFRH
jgi:glutamate decarboxylase